MKTNKGKLLVLALSAASFLALAGSVTGTVAWYQYSTRATAGILGSSKSVTENLQISTDQQNWKSDLTSEDIFKAAIQKANNANAASSITPLTSGNFNDKDNGLTNLYDAPQYQYGVGSYEGWNTAKIENYLQFDLYFRFVKKVDGKDNYVARDVKLADLNMTSVNTTSSVSDGDKLASAMRVHFASTTANALASKNGGTTDTNGALDLNGDGNNDTAKRYEWEDDGKALDYGIGSQNSYSAEATGVNNLVAKVEKNGDLTGGKVLTKTSNTTEAETSKITVTVWLEGWQKISFKAKDSNQSETTSASWGEDIFKDITFRIGMQFGCERDTDYTNPTEK